MIGKVLIVEDQYHFRRGLQLLIESSPYGWTEIVQAENGQKALAILDTYRPDLVFTDIRMPGMDGIQLSEYIYRHHKQTKIVVITGYKDFEYAQAALRYEVLDFLIKPCSEQEINRVLQKAYETMRERKLNLEKERLAEQARRVLTLRSILAKLPYDSADWTNLRKVIEGKSVCFLRVDDFLPRTKTYRESDIHLLQFAIGNIVQELFEINQWGGFTSWVDANVFAIFLEPSAKSGIETAVRDTITELLAIPVTMCPRYAWTTLDQLSNLYFRIRDSSTLPHEGSTDIRDYSLTRSNVKDISARLYPFLMTGDEISAHAYLLNYIRHMDELPLPEAKLAALGLAIALKETGQKEFGVRENQWSLDAQIEQLHTLASLQQAVEWAHRLAEQFVAAWETWRFGKNAADPIDTALEYIDNHYMDRIQLSDIAAYVHLHPNYFSNLFKRKTAESFISYVTRVRLEKAKLLLKNTNMKITAVAEAVGYDEPTYFANLFKQHTGLSPRLYRNQP